MTKFLEATLVVRILALLRPFSHRHTRFLIFLLCVIAGLGFRAWDQRRFWTRYNFREVIPGQVYAGGFQYPNALRGIVRQYKIRTVLTLLPSGSDDDRIEQETLRAMGVTFCRVLIPFSTTTGEPFENKEDMATAQLNAVNEAAAILASPENHPVFIHCRGGNHRTGAVIAVYRVHRCGWCESDARSELAYWGGFLGNTAWPSDVLRAYCASLSKVLHFDRRSDSVLSVTPDCWSSANCSRLSTIHANEQESNRGATHLQK